MPDSDGPDDWKPISAPTSTPNQAVPAAGPAVGSILPPDDWMPLQPPPPVANTIASQLQGAGPTLPERFIHGLAQPVLGLEQLAAKSGVVPFDPEMAVTPEGAQIIQNTRPADVEAARRTMEQQYQSGLRRQGVTGVDWPSIAGELANPINFLPIGLGGNLAVRLGAAALSSAGIAGMQPVDSDDYWSTKVRQLGIGAAAGAAGAGVASAVFPQMGADAARLTEAGIPLTPGQMAPIMRRPEEALKSFPILGNFIRSAEGRGTEGFNRAIVNQALEPVGETLPKSTAIGRDAISYAQDTLSKKYNDLVPSLTFTPTDKFNQGLDLIKKDVADVPSTAQIFDNIVNDRLTGRLATSPDGSLAGDTVKQLDSELANFSRRYSSSSDGAQRHAADAVSSLRGLIRDSLAETNPDAAVELKNINASYAMLTRLETAAQRRVGSDGVITPNDLLASIRQGDSTVRHRAFAGGDALMQEFAEAANRVLPSRLPDSGTAERTFWGLLSADILGGLAFSGSEGSIPIIAKSVGTGMALGLPYTRYGAPVAGAVPGIARAGFKALPGPIAGGIVGSSQ